MDTESVNICTLLCEDFDEINMSFLKVFDTIKVDHDGRAKFNLVVMTNIIGKDNYHLYLLMSYVLDENGNKVKKSRRIGSFALYNNDETTRVENASNIIAFKSFKFMGKGSYDLKCYLQRIAPEDKLQGDSDPALNESNSNSSNKNQMAISLSKDDFINGIKAENTKLISIIGFDVI
jgi:hypothetical protein